MRFGIFIPQGWRFDLVGIEPAELREEVVSDARAFLDRIKH